MYVSLDGRLVLVNDTFMWYRMDNFRVSVETSFNSIVHNESHTF